MNALLENLSKKLKEKLQKKDIPSFEKPMLATLTKNYFSDEDWIYEKKLDGIRCIVIKNKDRIFLKSRNNHLLNNSYPELVNAIKKTPLFQVIADGEIVAFDAHGISSFSKLQARLGVVHPSEALIKRVKVYLYIFDILYLDGYDITQLPLIKRKSILKQSFSFKDPLFYSIHKNKEGITFLKEACKRGWEGIIAKEKNSIYVHKRSKNWLKFKCVHQQEMVIGGYTEPQSSRIGFGALLLGYYDNGKLLYAGKVGTGYNDDFLRTFSTRLKSITTKKNPFSNKEKKDKNEHYVQPKFVAEIGFEEWTKDNKLRHPRFLGIREDKDPKKVIKEEPKNIAIPD